MFPSPQCFLLFLAMLCGCLFSNFSKLFFKRLILCHMWPLKSLFLKHVISSCFDKDFLKCLKQKENKKKKKRGKKKKKGKERKKYSLSLCRLVLC